MFGKSKKTVKRSPDQMMEKMNMIGSGTSIQGEINTEGDIRIDGKIKGTLNSKAKVVIGNGAVIEGFINCENAEIYGEVTGDIHVAELMHLKPTAVINGDIYVKKLIIENGAKVNGRCEMNDKPTEIFSTLNAERKISKEKAAAV